jgi:hypothetical protein
MTVRQKMSWEGTDHSPATTSSVKMSRQRESCEARVTDFLGRSGTYSFRRESRLHRNFYCSKSCSANACQSLFR